MAICRKCGVELTVGENWWPSYAKTSNYICIECAQNKNRQYYQERKEELRIASRQFLAEHGDCNLNYYRAHPGKESCRECGAGLIVKENWRPSCAKGGKRICITCQKVYDRQYRKEHKEKRTAYQRQYRIAHQSYYKKHRAEWKRKHPGYIKQWWEEHPNYMRRWRQANPDKVQEYRCRRRAHLANAIEKVNIQAIYDLYDNTCIYCGSKEHLTLDHILPLNQGGSHSEDNLVVACRSCNCSKQDTLLFDWLQTKPKTQAWIM